MIVVGIDEVGRGCWAGPVVAGAVILVGPIAGLTDSKKLSKKQRQILATQIYEQAAAIGLGWVDAATVDQKGLTEAVRLAMRRALEQIAIAYDQIIIDGNYNFLPDVAGTRTIVRADNSIAAVSAASIVAKVARDRYMAESKNAQLYAFDKHVGYGTALHLERLKLHGASELHRTSVKPVAALLQ